MLISERYQFVVALPTKCGTQSLRNMAIAWSEYDDDRADQLMEWPELRHRMVVPEGAEKFDRFIVVRDPYDRALSAFNYQLAHKNEWKHQWLQDRWYHHTEPELFTMWTEELMWERQMATHVRGPHGHRPHIWTHNLTELRRYLSWQGDVEPEEGGEHVGVLRLERLAEDWDALLNINGWEGVKPALRHNNKGSENNGGIGSVVGRGPELWRMMTEHGVDERFRAWIEADCLEFCYPLRG